MRDQKVIGLVEVVDVDATVMGAGCFEASCNGGIHLSFYIVSIVRNPARHLFLWEGK